MNEPPVLIVDDEAAMLEMLARAPLTRRSEMNPNDPN
jgi:hypothetical protein